MTESMKKALNKYYESNKQLNITISNKIYEIFVEYCKQMNKTKKEAIEKMITEYIDNNWYNSPITKYNALYSRFSGIVV